MLNSTKTWQERFNDKYKSGIWIDNGDGIYKNKADELKQFISDLRKQDEEELIKIVTGAWCVELDSDNLIKLIKNHYNK